MGTPNIWMLGLALRWTIFEFSNIRILGIGGHISTGGNPLAELQLPGPNLLAQVLRGGRQGAKGENSPGPAFCKRSGRLRYLRSAQPNFLRMKHSATFVRICPTTFVKGSARPYF
ncbi:Hypothetical predicted protein [Prunus dulcis]|uniref:Uncharacterized protein n=1 Tax=Prunus dulcis TaxID=3755 RepID=A0A5E4G1X0_PRUDU|nr:Hypothetical predicted protein [Prunus dulcis]